MSKFQKTFYWYSNCFKEKIVQEVSSGSSISDVCRRYGIKGSWFGCGSLAGKNC